MVIRDDITVIIDYAHTEEAVKKVIYDVYGRRLGSYDGKCTYDVYGRIIGYGNLLVLFIQDKISIE